MIFWRAAAAAAVVDAAAEAGEAAEECAQVAARAVAADTGRRPDARRRCRGQARDPLLGHPAAGRVRDQAAASGPVVRIARRWATCRRPAPGPVPRVLELDLALAADRATSPIDLAELDPAEPAPAVRNLAARDLVPAVVRATSPAAARGPARADVLAAVDHLPAISETFWIWVGPVVVAPVFDPAPRRPAARSQAARRLLS